MDKAFDVYLYPAGVMMPDSESILHCLNISRYMRASIENILKIGLIERVPEIVQCLSKLYLQTS
jgi:hypothetical protein